MKQVFDKLSLEKISVKPVGAAKAGGVPVVVLEAVERRLPLMLLGLFHCQWRLLIGPRKEFLHRSTSWHMLRWIPLTMFVNDDHDNVTG